MEKRCNQYHDCKDGTDEKHCRLIKIDKDEYKKQNTPKHRLNSTEKLQLEVGFNLLDMAKISEPEVTTIKDMNNLQLQVVHNLFIFISLVIFHTEIRGFNTME